MIIFFARLSHRHRDPCLPQPPSHAVLRRRAVIMEDDDDAVVRPPKEALRLHPAGRGQGARSLLLSLSGGELPASLLVTTICEGEYGA